ncbi:TonB-like protein [Neolewinella xylanilytica]|uniref:TonB-like protein n=1 Tax=Neolewinella xylanilytica TaxID=1514080 RepID=A0A2S6I3U6_9BACT|nr:energy transducer TonB [Neolewinella xylanilytica]PPK85729.1 TonB-like protein [Neolewinella xylanilytica]
MKSLFSILFLLPLWCFGQDTTLTEAVDTTIYSFADAAPRFPSPCERYDTTDAAKAACAQQFLLDYIYKRALYPPEAQEQNISGTAVIAFIVEPNGMINRPEILRDPGGGIGMSALRSVVGMGRELLWRPAMKDSMPVRFRYILPIRFRLEEPKPYVVIGADTVYTDLTKQATFIGNDGNLADYFNETITYPDIQQDSCATGQIDMQLFVHPSGLVTVNDIIDYNDLGVAFTGKAIDAATASFNQWIPAEYQGRKVISAQDVTFNFVPTDPGCAYVVEDYNEALQLMQDAQLMLTDSTALSAALGKMDDAIERFPRDGRFRILRGQVRLDNQMLPGACEDLSLARSVSLVDWYDSLLPLICRVSEEQEEE